MRYCNSMYSDYVNSLKLLVNNRLSLTVNMFIAFVIYV